MYRINLAAGAV